MSGRVLKVGTRGSKLALEQARRVREMLSGSWNRVQATRMAPPRAHNPKPRRIKPSISEMNVTARLATSIDGECPGSMFMFRLDAVNLLGAAFAT